MAHAKGSYYLPDPSHWPLVGSLGLFLALGGFGYFLTRGEHAGWAQAAPMILGFAVIIYMLFGWFGTVIRESEAGKYNDQVDVSFRMGMMWFIFSEVMFFAAFFGALFYIWQFSMPWLAGVDVETHNQLWNKFSTAWPMLVTPQAAMDAAQTTYINAKDYIHAWPIPTINTIILISSSFTVTFAHWAIKTNSRVKVNLWMLVTVLLGASFVVLQAVEYAHAYQELDLTLKGGGYATAFFMLTGFHGLHVTIGTIILTVIMFRCIKGHFKPEHHFGFEAAAWYWHFVDVVWICLYVLVYVIPET